MADLKTLRGVADKDRRMIEEAEALLGPEPSTMGFVKNLFWGNVREELVFPYPESNARGSRPVRQPDCPARCLSRKRAPCRPDRLAAGNPALGDRSAVRVWASWE